MSEKMTMTERVLEYMRKFGSITSLEAITELGCTRLSAYIFNIRHDMGIEVKDEWQQSKNRFGGSVTFKKYSLGDNDD